ncbi:MAG TPA: hypothetical protein VND80_06760 [Steroidobacteraceae bacterium]|nr:hypothetical protein [Steroidobacteraceae bacterium]
MLFAAHMRTGPPPSAEPVPVPDPLAKPSPRRTARAAAAVPNDAAPIEIAIDEEIDLTELAKRVGQRTR